MKAKRESVTVSPALGDLYVPPWQTELYNIAE